jgi:Ca2+-dependent lipid-binding protein
MEVNSTDWEMDSKDREVISTDREVNSIDIGRETTEVNLVVFVCSGVP